MSVCVVFKFVAQARLSELHDEIEKAEQQILRATEEFKQREEAAQLQKVGKSKAVSLRGSAVQLQKVGKSKAVPLRGSAENEMCFPLHKCVKTVFKQSLNQCCLFNCGITNFESDMVLALSSFISYHSG